jgi:hypothetical protein
MRRAGGLLLVLEERVPARADPIFCREISLRFDLRAKRWVLLAIVPV